MNNLVFNPNTKTVHSSTTIVNSQQLLSVNSPVYKGAYTPYTQTSQEKISRTDERETYVFLSSAYKRY